MPTIKYPPLPNSSTASQWNGGVPVLFTVSALGSITPLYDLALALYVNPESFDESMSKSKNVIMTYGGFVEYVWPDELTTVSASGSTGGFLSPQLGYTAAPSKPVGIANSLTGRRGTLAYERMTDFLELFRNNGIIYDGNGLPVLRSNIIMMYDRGAFIGHFTSFDVTEEEMNPFSMKISWEFKVETTIYKTNSVLSRRLDANG